MLFFGLVFCLLVVGFVFIFLLEHVRVSKGEDVAQVESTPLEVFNKMCRHGTCGHGFVWAGQSYIDSWILGIFSLNHMEFCNSMKMLCGKPTVLQGLSHKMKSRINVHDCKMI